MNLKVAKTMESLNNHLSEEVQYIRDTFKHMESELSAGKNVNHLLSKLLVDMERKWSRRECLELVGIPLSVKDDDLEKVFTKNFNKVGINITEKDMQAFHRIREEGRTFIKLSNRKDSQTVLKVKRGLNNLTMNDFGFEEDNKIYVNEILCPYYSML